MFRSSTTTHTSASVALLLTWVTGGYFTSVVVLIRMNMPEVYRKSVTAAIGDLQFPFFHRWSDVVFVVRSVFSRVTTMIQMPSREDAWPESSSLPHNSAVVSLLVVWRDWEARAMRLEHYQPTSPASRRRPPRSGKKSVLASGGSQRSGRSSVFVSPLLRASGSGKAKFG